VSGIFEVVFYHRRGKRVGLTRNHLRSMSLRWSVCRDVAGEFTILNLQLHLTDEIMDDSF
jgi:hypothetical protein